MFRKFESDKYKNIINNISNNKINHDIGIRKTIYNKMKSSLKFINKKDFYQKSIDEDDESIENNARLNLVINKQKKEKIALNKKNKPSFNNKIRRKIKLDRNIKLKVCDKSNKENKSGINTKNIIKIKKLEPELNKKEIINCIDKDNYFLNMSENASKRNIFEKSGNVKRINTIKINEFKVEKSNEESLRFTLLKMNTSKKVQKLKHQK